MKWLGLGSLDALYRLPETHIEAALELIRDNAPEDDDDGD